MAVDRYSLALVVVAVLCLALDTSYAGRSAQNLLAGITGLKCEFALHATGTWQDGKAQAEVTTSKLSLGFNSINTEESFATAVGGFGPPNIIVRLSEGTLHLMQVGSSSSLYVTTVFSKETRGGRLQAVHTRHDYTEVSLPGFTSRPEQYYGDCEVERDNVH